MDASTRARRERSFLDGSIGTSISTHINYDPDQLSLRGFDEGQAAARPRAR
jgi:hypothetical protein